MEEGQAYHPPEHVSPIDAALETFRETLEGKSIEELINELKILDKEDLESEGADEIMEELEMDDPGNVEGNNPEEIRRAKIKAMIKQEIEGRQARESEAA